MKVVFMGTPDFAVSTLEAIYEAGHEVSLVVTQPDKPKGRGGKMQYPDVKVWALEHDLPVFQPKRIRDAEAFEVLKKEEADIFIVAAFGQILPKEILELPRYGCVNVHASLLPKYRGAAPIQWAVMNGDKKSGVTTMQMGVGLDDGDILLKEEVVLAEDETGGSLFDRLAVVGGELCLRTMEGLEKGEITPIPQDESEATHVGMIKKEMGRLDFSRPAAELECWIRGLNPWPSAFCSLDGKNLKIWKAHVISIKDADASVDIKTAAVGCVVADSFLRDGKKEAGLCIKTGDDESLLVLDEVQLEGKKRMLVADFLRGRSVEAGTLLG